VEVVFYLAMKIISVRASLSAVIFAAIIPLAQADVGPFETEPTNQLTVKSPDGTSSLTVSLERIDKKKIRKVEKGKEQPPEAWLGERKLPEGILWRRPTLISDFSIKIDGKQIKIPARFWNDIAGFDLKKIVINKKPTNGEERWKLEEFINQVRNPKISRSRDGGTVMIKWIRPEE